MLLEGFAVKLIGQHLGHSGSRLSRCRTAGYACRNRW
jgi:hypothetical protein